MKKRYRKSGGVILRSCQMRSFLGIGSRCRKGGEWTDWGNNVSGSKSGFGRHEIGEGVRAIWRGDGNAKSCREKSHKMDDDLFNAVVREGKVPADWCKSWMISIYKGKGDALECGSYRGIKLLEHAMKVFERVIEARVRDRVKIDNMQFGFSPGKGTTDAIFIVRQLQEKYLAKKKDLWMAFIDLEKAFDRVPREVLWWALREV